MKTKDETGVNHSMQLVQQPVSTNPGNGWKENPLSFFGNVFRAPDVIRSDDEVIVGVKPWDAEW